MGSAQEETPRRPKAFERLPATGLGGLDDEDLVAYIERAREAGAAGAEREAMGVLVWGFWDRIRGWVGLKVPREDVEDVAAEVVASVMQSVFEGKAIGQFVSFLKTIVQRRIADYHLRGERRLKADPLGSEHTGEDEFRGPEPWSEDDSDALAVRDAASRVLERREPLHRRVIELYGPGVAGFDDLPADEVAGRIEADGERMSAANVHKIWQRFKDELREELRG